MVHSERTTARSSAQEPTCCHQSPTSKPLWPYFRKPVLRAISTLRPPWAGLPAITSFKRSGLSTSLYGVLSMVLPAYLFNSGLGSKLSTWLTPPHRKIQITDLALGGK